MTIPVTGSFLGVANATWLGLILNAAIKGTAVLAVGWILLGILRRQPAAVRGRIWMLVFLAVALVPSSFLRPTDPQRPSADPVHWQLAIAPAESSPVNSATPTESHAPAAGPELSHILPRMVAPLWLLGAILFCGRVLLAALGTRQLLAEAGIVADRRLLALIRRTRGELALGTNVAVLCCERVRIPFIWGVRHPKLVLPPGALHWSRARQQAVLRHELAHVARRDLARLVLIECVCILNWFNPLLWKAAARARLEIEKACDDRVLGLGAPTREYARQLLLCAAECGGARHIEGLLTFARHSDLEERMREILRRRPSARPLGRWRAALIALGLGSLVVPLGALPVVIARTDSPSLPVLGESASPAPVPAVELPPIAAALHAAARQGDRAAMADILARNPGALEARDPKGMTPLSLAAWNDHTALLADLIARGGEIDCRNANGLTPLFCALDRGRRTVALQLLVAGADIQARGYRRRTMLHNAARGGLFDIARHLVGRGADVNARDIDGLTPIQFAHAGEHVQIVEYLRSQGAVGGAESVLCAHKKQCPQIH